MTKLVPTTLVMIRKADDFSSVFGFRGRYFSEHLIVHYKPNQKTQRRVGFVVAKKIAKRAVDRNYMRRVLRELCRHEPALLDGADVVVQVKKPFRNQRFLILKQELNTLFVKIQHKIAQENK